MAGVKDLRIGENCFAQVKGWIPYPAYVLEKIKKGRTNRYKVLFYETEEINTVEEVKIWPVTEQSIKRFVTTYSLKRKHFKAAFDKMIVSEEAIRGKDCSDENIEEEVNTEMETVEQRVEVVTLPVNDVDEFDEANMDFDSLFRKNNRTNIFDMRYEETVESSEESDDEEQDDYGKEEADKSEDKGEKAEIEEEEEETLEVPVTGVDSPALEHIREAFGLGAVRNGTEAVTSVKKAGVKSKNKRVKSKTAPKKKVKKTLRDDEMALNHAFAEKILIDADNSFHCRDCPDFVTNVRLLARTHAQSCSATRKQPGKSRMKNIPCLDCDERFGSKRSLRRHFKECHDVASYTCFHCQKKIKSRVNFQKHLKLHRELTPIKCQYCDKSFSFKSYLNRHVLRVHKNKNEEEIQLCVEQKEVKSGENFTWEYQVFVPSTKNTENSYRADWVETMRSPAVHSDGGEGFEVAAYVNSNGDEKIVCVGSDRATETNVAAKDKDGEGILEEVLAWKMDGVDKILNGTLEEDKFDELVELALTDEELMKKLIEVTIDATAEALSSVTVDCREEVELDKSNNLEAPGETGEGSQDNCSEVEHGSVGSNLLKCQYCDAGGFQNAWFLNRHVDRMHLVPIKCEICEVTFVDKYWYVKHSKDCYYFCTVEGCGFFNKKKSRLDGHMRQHLRDS